MQITVKVFTKIKNWCSQWKLSFAGSNLSLVVLSLKIGQTENNIIIIRFTYQSTFRLVFFFASA